MKTCLCLRVETASGVTEGSIIETCDACNAQIWVSRSTLELRGSRDQAFTICEKCLVKMSPSGVQLAPPQPSQVRELRRFFGLKD